MALGKDVILNAVKGLRTRHRPGDASLHSQRSTLSLEARHPECNEGSPDRSTVPMSEIPRCTRDDVRRGYYEIT